MLKDYETDKPILETARLIIRMINGFQDAGEQIVLIDSDYEQTIKKLLD